jgi:hypothetical protein
MKCLILLSYFATFSFVAQLKGQEKAITRIEIKKEKAIKGTSKNELCFIQKFC